MTSPRVIDDGAKVGWGLVVIIITVYGVLVTLAGAAIAWAWVRWQKT